MQPLRAYLLVHSDAGWESSVHRDLGSLLDGWNPYVGRSDVTGVIHVGLDRPEMEAFESCAINHRGKMLLSASARWALTSVCECATSTVGEAAGIPLYVAINGWGYETSAEAIGLIKAVLAVSTKSGPFTPEQSGGIPHPFANLEDITSNIWLANLSCDDADLAMAANSAQIVDENSYWEGEARLATPLRLALGLYRYRVLSKNDEPDDPLAVIRHAPPWLLQVGLQSLELSVRVSNVLAAKSFSIVGDVTNISLEKLQKLPNFGRTSQQHFAERLRAAIERGPSIFGSSSLPPTATGVVNVAASNSLNTEKLGSQFINLDALSSVIRAAISSLSPNHEIAVRGRMGLGVDPATLEELGSRMGVTRERIRQLEAKGMLILGRDPIWKDVLEAKLSNLLDERDDPLPFSGLAILDPWFKEIEQMQHPFGYLLEHKNILDQRFSLLRANGQWFVSRLSQREWDLVVKHAMHLLEGGVAQGWRQAEARQHVDDMLSGRGRELRAELWSAATQLAHFSSSPSDGESRLISYGKSADVLVKAILSESERPLHYSEIPIRIAERYGKQIEIRRAHNAAANIALLYGKGFYGLIKHCPLDYQERELVRDEALEIISHGISGHQWSCAELMDILNERGLDFDGRLNSYTLNITLMDSNEVNYLGRYLWVQSATASVDGARRIDIRQAVTSLLMQAGRPMSNSEIKEALRKDRGISRSFQIFPSGSIISVGTGVWGLIERDLALNNAEQAHLIDILQKMLKDRNSGIHISEIASCLDGIFEPASSIKDPEVLFAVAQRSSLIRRSPGGYLFLSEWGEPRRMQKSQAVLEALRKSGEAGLTASEIVKIASGILGREIPQANIYGDINNAGARFNEEKKRWILPDTDEVEDEESIV